MMKNVRQDKIIKPNDNAPWQCNVNDMSDLEVLVGTARLVDCGEGYDWSDWSGLLLE